MKHSYRLRRRHGAWGAGAVVELTEDEAIRINNEAPGAIEGPIVVELPKPALKVKAAEPDTDTVAERRRVLFKEPI
jgi:hypothetical protein